MTTKTRSDSAVQQAVLAELRWDTRVNETAIGVSVSDGIVTLSGGVASFAERKAAEEAAHRVEDVLDVANEIEVRLPGSLQRNDTDLAGAVRNALRWHSHVPDDRIITTVSSGAVTLEGEVDVWSQRDAAEQAIASLTGVRMVFNQIRMKPTHAGPEDLRAAINAALSRQAEREAKAITIEEHDGVVLLSGRVRSWRERDAVLGAARGTRGVRSVESRLRIESFSP